MWLCFHFGFLNLGVKMNLLNLFLWPTTFCPLDAKEAETSSLNGVNLNWLTNKGRASMPATASTGMAQSGYGMPSSLSTFAFWLGGLHKYNTQKHRTLNLHLIGGDGHFRIFESLTTIQQLLGVIARINRSLLLANIAQSLAKWAYFLQEWSESAVKGCESQSTSLSWVRSAIKRGFVFLHEEFFLVKAMEWERKW